MKCPRSHSAPKGVLVPLHVDNTPVIVRPFLTKSAVATEGLAGIMCYVSLTSATSCELL